MVISQKEIEKQGLKIKGSYPENKVLDIAKIFIDSDVKEIRIYKETELEKGINPNNYCLFIRRE